MSTGEKANVQIDLNVKSNAEEVAEKLQKYATDAQTAYGKLKKDIDLVRSASGTATDTLAKGLETATAKAKTLSKHLATLSNAVAGYEALVNKSLTQGTVTNLKYGNQDYIKSYIALQKIAIDNQVRLNTLTRQSVSPSDLKISGTTYAERKQSEKVLKDLLSYSDVGIAYKEKQLQDKNAKMEAALDPRTELRSFLSNKKTASAYGDAALNQNIAGMAITSSASLEKFNTAVDKRNTLLEKSTKELKEQTTAQESSNTAVDKAKARQDRLNETLGLTQLRIMANYAAINSLVNSFKYLINYTVQYDEELHQVQAIAAISDTSMQSLKGTIEGVANSTKFTSLEVAKATTTLAQAGLSVEQIKNTLPAIAKLATATGTDLATSTDVLTSTLNIYNLQVSEAERITNSLTTAMNESKADIGGFQTAIQYAGNFASQLGMSYEETAAAIAAATNAGIRSKSMLGTGLRAVLTEFLKPTTKLQKELESVGLTVDDIDVKTKGFVNVLRTLKEAGFGAEEAFKGMERRGAAFLAALINQTDYMDELRGQMAGSTAATKANDVQMQSLSFQWKNFQSILGTAAANGLEPVTKSLSSLLSVINSILQTQSGSLVAQVLFGTGTAIAGLKTAGYMLSTLTDIIKKAKELGLLAATFGKVGWVGVFLAVADIVYTLSKRYNWFTSELEKATAAFEEQTGKVEEAKTSLSEAQTMLDKLYSNQEKLNTESERNIFAREIISRFPEANNLLDITSASLGDIEKALKELNNIKMDKLIDQLQTSATTAQEVLSLTESKPSKLKNWLGQVTGEQEDLDKRRREAVAKVFGNDTLANMMPNLKALREQSDSTRGGTLSPLKSRFYNPQDISNQLVNLGDFIRNIAGNKDVRDSFRTAIQNRAKQAVPTDTDVVNFGDFVRNIFGNKNIRDKAESAIKNVFSDQSILDQYGDQMQDFYKAFEDYVSDGLSLKQTADRLKSIKTELVGITDESDPLLDVLDKMIAKYQALDELNTAETGKAIKEGFSDVIDDLENQMKSAASSTKELAGEIKTASAEGMTAKEVQEKYNQAVLDTERVTEELQQKLTAAKQAKDRTSFAAALGADPEQISKIFDDIQKVNGDITDEQIIKMFSSSLSDQTNSLMTNVDENANMLAKVIVAAVEGSDVVIGKAAVKAAKAAMSEKNITQDEFVKQAQKYIGVSLAASGYQEKHRTTDISRLTSKEAAGYWLNKDNSEMSTSQMLTQLGYTKEEMADLIPTLADVRKASVSYNQVLDKQASTMAKNATRLDKIMLKTDWFFYKIDAELSKAKSEYNDAVFANNAQSRKTEGYIAAAERSGMDTTGLSATLAAQQEQANRDLVNIQAAYAAKLQEQLDKLTNSDLFKNAQKNYEDAEAAYKNADQNNVTQLASLKQKYDAAANTWKKMESKQTDIKSKLDDINENIEKSNAEQEYLEKYRKYTTSEKITEGASGALNAWQVNNRKYTSETWLTSLSSEMTTSALETATDQAQTLFKTILDGTDSASNAFKSFGRAVIEAMRDIAVKYAANAAMQALFGGASDSTQSSSSSGLVQAGWTALKTWAMSAQGGVVVGPEKNRDSVLTKLMPGEYVLKKSAVDAIGQDYLDQLNTNTGSTISSSTSDLEAARGNTENGGNTGVGGTVNVYVVSQQEQQAMTPNDVIVTITQDMIKGGQTKKLVKQISMGAI